jgi:isopentenyl diphosphate isomerase/L-lactate dehydrogenase-like FMN-dependent dehydrogenase
MPENDSTDATDGPTRQRELFFEALAGESSSIPLNPEKLREAAKESMDPGAYGYVAGSAGREETARDNRDVFTDYKLTPRVLNGIDERSLSTTLLDQPVPSPLLLAPVGVQSIIHSQGAKASARAACSLGVPFVHSTVSSFTLEEIAELEWEGPLLFQLYWSSLPELNESLIQRAEKAGYDGLVITLDTPLMGWRPRDLEQGYFPFLEGEGLANYTNDPVFRDQLSTPPEESMDEVIELFIEIFSNPSAGWRELERLVQSTSLPTVAKGILHPDDAEQARDAGLDGIIVSNHGGRQIDGEIPALEALHKISNAELDELSLWFDSGIRTGSDVLKAYALGADAILIGRPYLYGLALEGENGVKEVMKNLHAELDIIMGLCGYEDINNVTREVLTDHD